MDSVTMLPGERSGAYISIQNEKGELVATVSDMQIMQQFGPERAERALESLLNDTEASSIEGGASKEDRDQLHSQPSEQIEAPHRRSRPGCIVADANIPAKTIQRLAQKAEENGLPFFLEPVSVGKGRRLIGVPFSASWTTPNGDEFRELWGISREDWQKFESNLHSLHAFQLAGEPEQSQDQPQKQSHRRFQNVGDPKGESCIALPLGKEALEPLKLDDRSQGGIDSDHILITLGARGLLLLSRDPDILKRNAGQFKPAQDKQAGWRGWWFPPRPVRIKDPNGAGDSFLAGFLAALYHPDLQWPVKKAICFGQAAARCSLESEHTVAPDMNVESVLEALQFSDNQNRQ